MKKLPLQGLKKKKVLIYLLKKYLHGDDNSDSESEATSEASVSGLYSKVFLHDLEDTPVYLTIDLLIT